MTRIPIIATTATITTTAASLLAAASVTVSDEKWLNHKAAPILTAVAPGAGLVGATGLLTTAGLLLTGHPRLAAITGTAAATTLLTTRGKIWPRIPTDTKTKLHPDDVRILLHNVWINNKDDGENIGKEIVTANPDILVLIEATNTSIKHAQKTLQTYPYKWIWETTDNVGADGMLIASKYPLTDVTSLPECGRSAVSMLVTVRGKKIRLIATHTHAPITQETTVEWSRQLHALRNHLEWVGDRSVVVLGDFNATHNHAPFRRLMTQQHLTDVVGGATTWPHGRFYPTLLGIDHILIRGMVKPLRVRIEDGNGSDHKAVIADLRFT